MLELKMQYVKWNFTECLNSSMEIIEETARELEDKWK